MIVIQLYLPINIWYFEKIDFLLIIVYYRAFCLLSTKNYAWFSKMLSEKDFKSKFELWKNRVLRSEITPCTEHGPPIW